MNSSNRAFPVYVNTYIHMCSMCRLLARVSKYRWMVSRQMPRWAHEKVGRLCGGPGGLSPPTKQSHREGIPPSLIMYYRGGVTPIIHYTNPGTNNRDTPCFPSTRASLWKSPSAPRAPSQCCCRNRAQRFPQGPPIQRPPTLKWNGAEAD